MKGRILLVTTIDEAYHQLLLQNQGYEVDKAARVEAITKLERDGYQLVLITPEGTVEKSLAFCNEVKKSGPQARIVLIARRAEYIPPNDWVDALTREQSTPQQFLSIIRKTIETEVEKGRAAAVPYDVEDE